MPDFTVIEGGGQGPESARAEEAFASLIRECVKVLGSQDGYSYRVTEAFFGFVEAIRGTDLNVHHIVTAAAAGMREQMRDDNSDWVRDRVIRAALMLAAEMTTDDNLSRARRSKRDMQLEEAISSLVLEHERLTRERGWSFLHKLLDSLEPWPPAPKPRAAPKRKPKNT